MKQQDQLTNLNNLEKITAEADNSSIVHDAATNHDLEKLEFLINQNPGLIYAKDSSGKTPLEIALNSNQKDTVNYMLGKIKYPNVPLGFNPHIFTNKDGYFPLNAAIDIGNTEIVQHLLNIGASVDATDNLDRTGLTFATALGNIGIVKSLLTAGANSNKKDIGDVTPFSIAAQHLDLDILELFVDATCKTTSPYKFILDKNIKLEDAILSSIRSATSFEEVKKRCQAILENKNKIVEVLDNNSDFNEALKHTVELAFGESESAQSMVPKLKLLALAQVTDFKTAFKKIGDASEDLYRLGADYKLLSQEQIINAEIALKNIEETQNLLGEEAAQELI